MGKEWRLLFIMVVIMVAAIGTGVIFSDAFQGKRNWIDQCVVQEWESTGERHVGVRDYCLAKYRQTR